LEIIFPDFEIGLSDFYPNLLFERGQAAGHFTAIESQQAGDVSRFYTRMFLDLIIDAFEFFVVRSARHVRPPYR